MHPGAELPAIRRRPDTLLRYFDSFMAFTIERTSRGIRIHANRRGGGLLPFSTFFFFLPQVHIHETIHKHIKSIIYYTIGTVDMDGNYERIGCIRTAEAQRGFSNFVPSRRDYGGGRSEKCDLFSKVECDRRKRGHIRATEPRNCTHIFLWPVSAIDTKIGAFGMQRSERE